MQFIKTLVRLLVFLFPVAALSQTTYLPQGDKQNIILERLEIKGLIKPIMDGKIFPVPYSLSDKPYSRKIITEYVQQIDSAYGTGTVLSKVDQYNVTSLL